MMQLIHKRALSLLLSAALVLTMLPVTALAATTENRVPYLNSSGHQSSADGVTAIDSGSTTLNSGWYMVDSGVTIGQTVTVSGDVNLILADGASLTVNGTSGDNAGINVTQGNSLSIYAQSIGSGMGRLTATGSGNGTGIGSAGHDLCGTISIYGGRITATGGSGGAGAAGIGNVTGASDHFGTIGIYGGFITATNGHFANFPDIGGNGDGTDSITIKGGTIVSNWGTSQVTLGNQEINLTMPELVLDGGSIQLGVMNSSSSDPNPLKNSAGNPVSLSGDSWTIPGHANAAVASVSIDGVPYGRNLYTNDKGTLYLHLPAYGSIVPVVVTMDDGSRYWAAYKPTGKFPPQYMTLVNAPESSVLPGTAVFDYRNQDITVYKLDPNHVFSGIYNGGTPLTPDRDYTVAGDTVIIKKEYLATLPSGNAVLNFDGLNSALVVRVLAAPEYVGLGDSIASGYGLPGYSPKTPSPPATAYTSIVGTTLGLSIGYGESDGITSGDLLQKLSDTEHRAYLSKAKVITLSVGSDDILIPFLEIVANKLDCDPSNVQSALALLARSDPQRLATAIFALNADDGSGLKNNPAIAQAASGFAQNFQSIISAIKTAAPNAKIYVTNVYNPYEGISINYGSGTLNLGDIANGYIQTLNGAFSSSSPDYTLVNTYSAFSNSLHNGIRLVNADLLTFNFDPHPNVAGHAKIAGMILYSGSHPSTAQTVSTAIGNLSAHSTPSEIASLIAQALGLSTAAQAALAPQQVASLEALMPGALGISAPVISAPVTTGFTGGSALPGTPTVTGLALATYGGTGATLATTQVAPPADIPGGTVAFDLTLTEGGSSQAIHSALPFPLTVTVPLPTNFVPQAVTQYELAHTLPDGSKEYLHGIIGVTTKNYTLTFTTVSLSTFTLVKIANGSSSGSHTSSSVSVPTPGAVERTFISDTNADFSVNGAYQFKITSQNGIAPLLTVGTPGIFETQLVRVSGNDYYFKLISVGKAGEKAGVYVNGVKLLAATVGTAAAPVKSDTTGSLKVAKGKTYTFKLTADGKPSFVCGNSSVFLVKFLRKSGKDYFYQVTAVGKPGQTAGFYLNSAKKPVAAAAVA